MKPNVPTIKYGVSFTRVSSPGQEEISPDTQKNINREQLIEAGYTEDRIVYIHTTHSSLTLFKDPEFVKLMEMIQRREVGHLAVYNPDRLEANPLRRASFINELNKAKIKLLAHEGNAQVEGSLGELFSYLDAWQKSTQVLRTHSGAKKGLHDRVTEKGKPTSYNPPGYGLMWERPNQNQPPTNVIIKDDNYDNAVFIFGLKLAGYYTKKIRKILYAKGILPVKFEQTHNPWWGEPSIRYLLQNPVYAGRYYALRNETVRKNELGEDDNEADPKTIRHGEDYGTYMSNIEVRDPIITWAEHLDILESFPKAKHFASRNAKEPYLLQGMIYGEDNHTYIGRHDKKTWRYANYQESHSVHGDKIEVAVKAKVREIFTGTDQSFWQRFVRLDNLNKPKLEKELVDKKKKKQKIIDAQTNLVKNLAALSSVEFNPEAIKGATASLNTELAMIDKGITDLENQIAEADSVAEKVSSFLTIKERFATVLSGNDNTRWRDLLIALDCRIKILPADKSPSVYDDTRRWQKMNDWLVDEESGVIVNHNNRFTTELTIEGRKNKNPRKIVMYLYGGQKVQPEKIVAISEPLIENNGVKCAI